jgi:hypothetical protein
MKQSITPIAFIFMATGLMSTMPASAASSGLPVHRVHIRTDNVSFPFTVELTPTDDVHVLHAQICNPMGVRLYVRLLDPEGNTLDNFSIGKDTYKTVRPYNFSSMAPAGVYTLEVSNNVRSVTKKIKVQHAVTVAVDRISVE